MKHLLNNTRVLVASDNIDNADLIQQQLSAHFSQVQVSTDAERRLQEFEHHAPEVLILAFDRLDKAQRYYLGLYRQGAGLQQRPHRTVILCSKEDVHEVFDLCKQAYFDDYVLYWPHSHDGTRLTMSVWNAGRAVTDARSGAPHAPGQSTAPALPSSPPLLDDQARRERREVMVVDDDAFVRMLVGRVLDPTVWETTFAVDGATALAQLDRHRPDVILMDIHLPGLDGVTLTQRLKSTSRLADIPIVMMTGDASKTALLNSLEAGAVSFVVKPFTRESLMSKLQAVLTP